MTIVTLCVALLTIFVAGWAVITSVTKNDTVIAERCAMAWLLGCGVISILLFVGGHFLAGVTLRLTVIAVVAAGAAVVWRRRVSNRSATAQPSRGTVIDRLLIAVVAIEVALICAASFRHTLGWDGLLNWEIKARYACLTGGRIPATYYTDVGRVFSHPEYPPCIPLCELWLYLWAGEANQFASKLIFPLFCAAGIILLGVTTARLCHSRKLGFLAAALCGLVPYLTQGSGAVVVGYADWPLATYYLATIGYLLLYLREGNPDHFRLHALSLALLPWIKREGMVLWLIAAGLSAFALGRRRAPVGSFVWLVAGVVLLVGWRAYLTAVHCLPSHDFVAISRASITQATARVFPIASEAALELIRTGDWSIFWPIFFASATYLLLRARDATTCTALIAIVLPLVIFSGSYLFSAWPDYIAHIDTSLPRLLMQVLPIAWLVVGRAVSRSIITSPTELAKPSATAAQ